jgi:MYXO-CTERM domain-containing protein
VKKTTLVAVTTTLLLATLVERSVFACAPPEPGIESTVPAAGGGYPANAMPLVYGQFYYRDPATMPLTATIDGEPATATLEPVEGWELRVANGIRSPDLQTVKLDPLPAPGQRVVVEGKVCDIELLRCDLALDYVAVENDSRSPVAPGVTFNVWDHVDEPSEDNGCGGTDPATDVSYNLELEAAAAEGSPTFFLVEASADAQFTTTVKRRVVTGDTTGLWLGFTTSVLGSGSVAEALCFRITAFDMAGNTTVGEPVCRAAHCQVDAADAGLPEWNDDNAYAGTCRTVAAGEDPTPEPPATPATPGTPGTPEQPTGDDRDPPVDTRSGSGCSISAGPASADSSLPALLLAMVAVAVLRRRRCR